MALARRIPEGPGTPLADVCFCVVDLETTGGSPRTCAITEVGALKVRRGEVLGSFQTLVDPGHQVPAFVRLLTGISDSMLVEAPPIEAVLPSFLEFLGGSVLVAHNARFDVSFLDAALDACGYERLSNPVVDTALLARKLLTGETPNFRLDTLAATLRCAHRPRHRAFADALTATDVLHCLIERASGFGATTLEDLLEMSVTRIDGTFAKISLCAELPRGPGVYRFLGPSGNTLYVGKATDVKNRVRSYFYGDRRGRMRDLLRETQRIVAEPHASTLEAEVAEIRAIAREMPPYNRANKPGASWYVKIDHRARAPRLSCVRVPKEDGAVYLGPVRSARTARELVDCFRDVLPVHRCTFPARCRGCAFGEMKRCPGGLSEQHRAALAELAWAVSRDPGLVLGRLRTRLRELAAWERFEEATQVRARMDLLGRILTTRVETQGLLDAGAVTLRDGARAWLIVHGQLAAASSADRCASLSPSGRAAVIPVGSFWPPRAYDEARVVARWIGRNAASLRIVEVEGTWALPATAAVSP